MDGAEALAQRAVVGEQLDRRAAVGGPALLVLGRLLGHVGVQRRAAGLGPRRHDRDGGRVDGPHGVHGGADAHARPVGQAGGSLGPRLGVAVGEPALGGVGRDAEPPWR